MHYSRLCNLLLGRGKISPELGGLTRAALGDDSEKEDFFLRYEMTDQLFSFYTSKGRYLDAFNLAIRNSDLDKAWQVIEMDGEYCRLPQRQKIDVFNYIQVKHLLAKLDASPTQVFSSSTSRSLACPWLSNDSSIEEFWEDLEETVGALLSNEVSYDSIYFAEPWMKQLFDIIVSDLYELTTVISLISVVGHFQSPRFHRLGQNNEGVAG